MNTDASSEQPTVEELLQRIREKVQSRASEPPKPRSSGSSSLLQKSDFYSLQELKESAAAAYSHHNQVGRINPRNPGLRNDLIQMLKKGIQRTLGWYTRPLNLFQASTARTLMEVSRALEDVQQKQLYISEQIAQLESELRSEMTRLKATVEHIQSTDTGTADLSIVDSHGESKSNQSES